MTVEIGSLVIQASFTDDSSEGDMSESTTADALALTERRIMDQVADMITEALRRREER